MDFRDYAATETKTLIAGLLSGRSKQSLGDLQAFKRALDEAARAFESTLSAAPDADGDVAQLIDRLAGASESQLKAATEHAAHEAQSRIDAQRREFEEQADALRAELKTQTERAEFARAEWAKAHDAHTQAEAARQEAEADREKEAHARAIADADRADLQAKLDGAITAQAAVQKRLTETEAAQAAFQQRIADADSALKAMQQRVADAEREVGRARMDAEAAKQAAKQAGAPAKGQAAPAPSSPALDRLLAVYQKLATCTDIPDVLIAIANGLANDFSRVGLFNVKGNRLEGRYHVGLDFKVDIAKVVVPLTLDSPLTQAVTANRVEALAAKELADNTRSLFGGSPTSVLVLPITIHGEPMAVIYADDSEQSQAESAPFEDRTKFAELLHRHAVPVLEKLQVELKTHAELREYAKLLLDEVEYMYAGDVSAGKKDTDIKSHLKDNLASARQLYSQRIASEGPSAAMLLEELLGSVIESKSGTPFSRDLMALASKAGPSAAKKSSRQAQAS